MYGKNVQATGSLRTSSQDKDLWRT